MKIRNSNVIFCASTSCWQRYALNIVLDRFFFDSVNLVKLGSRPNLAQVITTGRAPTWMLNTCFVLAVLSLGTTGAFYLPGVAPRAFKEGEAVNMKVQTLVSTETPLQVLED